jgi:hypothetical protein
MRSALPEPWGEERKLRLAQPSYAIELVGEKMMGGQSGGAVLFECRFHAAALI